MKKRATLVDVALAAGVSKMTASRALRGAKDVSRANAEKVRKAAETVGYVGNPLASSLSGKRADLIGVVVPNLTNVVFPQVMSGITSVLDGTGLQSVFGVTDYSADKEYDVVRGMLSWRPAGLIVTGMELADNTQQILTDANIPVVQIMDTDGDPIDACVGFSHDLAGFDMGQALIKSGRRRFGYVGCGLGKDLRAAKRKAGFMRALAQEGLALIGEQLDDDLSSVEGGRRLTAQLWDRCPDLDCIYYSNDDAAMGGLGQCIDAGLAVPDRVALAGFNGLGLLQGFPGKIATTRTPRREIGELAVRVILSTLAGQGGARGQVHVLKPEIELGAISGT